MDEKELEKLNARKAEIKRLIDKIYSTTSLNVETQATEDLIKEIKKLTHDEMIDFTKEQDVFGKCVLHYRLPIEMRMDVEFSKVSTVDEFDRKSYWVEYKKKLKGNSLNPEEEYNKIIMMACILHVPIKEEENTESEN